MSNNNFQCLLRGFFAGTLIIFSAGCNTDTRKEETHVLTEAEMVAKGEHLVNAGLCHDCHTPKIMTPNGPVTDTTRLLSGSPSDQPLPPIPPKASIEGKWILASNDLTSWVGPWGISFAANLTPDSVTGTGTWTEELFIKILRTGKFMGVESGRNIMPPMPWDKIRLMTDEELKCIFAYLQSIPPVKNNVNPWIPPGEMPEQ